MTTADANGTGAGREGREGRDADLEPHRAPTLLIVDDDDAFRMTLGRALGRRGFATTLAANADEAEARAKEQVFEYAIVDVRMPGRSGIEVVAALKEIDAETRIVVLTGYGTIANAVSAMQAGAADYLTKPVDASACERALLGTSGAAQAGEGDRSERAERRETAATEEDAIPSLDRVEYEYLQRVMADVGGNISEAARRLGMHRRSLQRKLARLPPRR